MGLGNKVNKFNFGENDLANEGSGADGDSRDEGDGFGAVACSICLETVVKNGDRAWANLQCGHQFHLETNRRSTTNSSEQHSKDMVILSQIDAGNFSEAEALLTQVLELKPYGGLHRIFKHRLLELGDYRSVAKLGMLDYSGALRDISQALALAPNYSESYICQGDVYVAKGQYDLAEKSYLKCLEIDPSLRRSKSFKARIANLQKKVVEVDVT